MVLYLESQNDKIIARGKTGIITTNGRVYINKEFVERATITEGAIYLHYRNGQPKQIPISKGQRYGEIIYKYNKNNGIDLSEYLKLTDRFMLFLISKGCNISFEAAVKEFGINMSIGVKSLLKPTYARYIMASKDPINLEKIKANIERGILPKKLVLYDVPAVVEESKLKLIGNIYIDISEEDVIGREVCQYNCISLGTIKKFDRVEIELNYDEVRKITLKGQGYY